MPRAEKQKQKLLRLIEIFTAKTDSEHGLTMPEIISSLAEYGISAERKSIYDDLITLEELGFSVEKMSTRPPRYTLSDRIFELAELKLLVDAISSSRFITREHSHRLIDKLKRFASDYEAGELSRQIHVEGKAKTVNKATLYTIDGIHKAINENRRIRFKYFTFNKMKERVLRRGGAWYEVSPIGLVWDDENYYLVAFDEQSGEPRNLRVDKMQSLSVTDVAVSDAARRQARQLPDYSTGVFGMFGGDEVTVTLDCTEDLASVIIDRFGSEHTFMPHDCGFTVSVPVVVSPVFFAWVMSFGGRMRILSPSDVRAEFIHTLKTLMEGYDSNEGI
ncbi:MAG: WYL domain-containing protein [Clostridia bacterium]|nr:WYL domain-containing protein [Clostridia bacterium]